MLPQQAPPESPMSPPMPGGGGGGDKQAIVQQLVTMLTKAKQFAESNGIPFAQIISAMEGSTEGASQPAPPLPPSPMG